MAYKSRFTPNNLEKYSGDASKIICRSSWERSFAHNLDTNKHVEKWASEELVVPYVSPVDKKPHRYFPDFIVKFTNGKTVIFEVKPYAETLVPVKPKRNTKKAVNRYMNSIKTYLVNQAKWEAARKLAAKNNAVFEVITEHELRAMGCHI